MKPKRKEALTHCNAPTEKPIFTVYENGYNRAIQEYEDYLPDTVEIMETLCENLSVDRYGCITGLKEVAIMLGKRIGVTPNKQNGG